MNDKLTDLDIKVMYQAIKDYKNMKYLVDTLVSLGYDFNKLVEYLEKLEGLDTIEIENAEKENSCCDYSYMDFGFNSLTMTLSNYGNIPHLTDSVELWNNINCSYLGQYYNINEIEEDIKIHNHLKDLSKKGEQLASEFNDDDLKVIIDEMNFWYNERLKQNTQN